MLLRIFSLFFCFLLSSFLYAKDLTIIYTAKMRDVTNQTFGTYSNLHTLLKEYRSKDDVVFLFGGNSLGPSFISNMDQGSHIVSILNMLEPDLSAAINSDFMFGINELSLRAEEANFPIILSNIYDKDGENIFNTLPYTIVSKAGIKIGVMSIVEQKLRYKYNAGKIKIQDIKQAIKKNTSILRQKGADIVIALTTGHFSFPKELLGEKKVDLVLSKNPNILQSHKSTSKNVYNLDSLDKVAVIKVKKQKNSFSFDISEKSLKDYKKDDEIDKIIAAYDTELNSFMKQKIGVVKSEFNTNRKELRTKENTFANLISDAVREYTNSDLALINAGIIRGEKTYKKGDIFTRKDMLTVLPFKEKVVLVKISGKDILDILEHGLKDINNDSGKFLHISGGKIIFNSKLRAGFRVVRVFIGGKKLREDKMYKLATLNFLYNGGDGFDGFKNGKRIREYKLDYRTLSDILTDYIIAKKEIDYHLEHRLKNIAK